MKHRHTNQQCGLDDCARDIPDTAYVCVECAERLHRLLLLLPDQERQRARVLTYPHLPFDADTNPYRETGDVPVRHGLAADLDDAITRPTVVHPDQTDATYAQTAATTPLPYGYTPSEAKWVLLDTLRRWGDDIAHRRGLFRPFDTLQALGPWLAAQVGWLRQQPDGPAAIDEMTAGLRNALRVIDRPADRKYAGPCTATITDPDGLARDCDGELYARPGAHAIPCPSCGAEYDVADRRAWLLAQIDDMAFPVSDLARVLNGLGVPVTSSQIYGLVHRKTLVPTTERDGRKLFTPRHVIEQLRRVNAARRSVKVPA
ncbi:hypothetical protein ACFT5B_06890 [Luteimicrobium sp. NPDC057192]|uniref:hypothetical protein n=1 Tax=Luteimicrobium sp. NPDC057192 TaxID=3346042 RepID=UPI00362E3DB7